MLGESHGQALNLQMYQGGFDTSDWPSQVRDRGLEEFQDPDQANATMKQIVVGCSLSIARLFVRSSTTRQAEGLDIQVGMMLPEKVA